MTSPRRRRRAASALLLPLWLGLGVFFLAPLARMLEVSFARRGTYGGLEAIPDPWAYVASGAFLDNYARSFSAI